MVSSGSLSEILGWGISPASACT